MVFWVSVPFGVAGTIWAYLSLHSSGARRTQKIDWPGNATFAAGLILLLVGIVYAIQPYGGHAEGWTNPFVLGCLVAGVLVLIGFCVIERRVAQPMFALRLFGIKAFAFGNVATLMGSLSRGGLQFMLIIWLPLHGYDYEQTPLWSAIYMVPLTIGFLGTAPVSGWLSDRFGARIFATGGLVIVALTFGALLLLPTDFTYWQFALILFVNGLGSGLFAAPNVTGVMNSLPADQRGAGSGMLSTLQNSGMALSIGVFFSTLIAGLATTMPAALVGRVTEAPAGGSAGVRTVDRAGDAVPARLTLVDFNGVQLARTQAESDGRFRLPGPPGAAVLVFASPGHDPYAKLVTPADVEHTKTSSSPAQGHPQQ